MFKLIEKIKKAIYGVRKYSIMLVFITIAITFRIKGLISGSDMTQLLSVTGSAFFASNLFSKFAKHKQEE